VDGSLNLNWLLDGRNIRGKDAKSVESNFARYNLASLFLDAMTLDITQSPLRQGMLFDAIVCDRTPLNMLSDTVAPYGVRAGAKRLGSKKNMDTPVIRKDGSIAHTYILALRELIAHRMPDFVYPTVVYELSDVLNDLMSFSARHLRPDGRLVFWLPTIPDTEHGNIYPQHPHLRLISNSEQKFGQCDTPGIKSNISRVS
jgi:tRNA (guanine10-N2)-methyltransferase